MKFSPNIAHYSFIGRGATVYIRFIVQAAGGIRDIQVMKSPKECNMLEKEAIRVVKLSGKYWKAGKQNGKKVDVSFNLPVRFKLQ